MVGKVTAAGGKIYVQAIIQLAVRKVTAELITATQEVTAAGPWQQAAAVKAASERE